MKLKSFFNDTIVMSNRIIKYSTRSADTIITVLVTPIFMMLAFVYIFGGAMNTGDVRYVTYIVPGILIMCIGSAVAYTALRVNNDVIKGIFERFHSMPIARSSILAGHIISSVILNIVSIIAILGIALLIGFRPEADIVGWLLITFILLLTILAMTLMAVAFGILAKSNEGAGVFSYIIIFRFVYKLCICTNKHYAYCYSCFCRKSTNNTDC